MQTRLRQVWVWAAILVGEDATALPTEVHVAIVRVLRHLDLVTAQGRHECTGDARATLWKRRVLYMSLQRGPRSTGHRTPS